MGILIIIGIIIFCILTAEFNESINKDKTIQILQQQLKDAETIEEILQQQLEGSEKTKQQTIIQKNILEKDNEKLNNDINNLNTKIKDLENTPSNKEKLALKEEIKQYEETIKQYETTIKQYETTIKQHEATINQKTAQNDKQNQSIRTYLKEINIEHKPKIRSLENELSNEKKLNEDLEKQLSDKKELNIELTNKVKQYELQITEINELKNQINKYKFDIDDLENQISKYKSKISNLKNQISKYKSKISNLKNQISKNKSKISDLENQISKNKSKISDLENQISEYKSKINDLESQLSKKEEYQNMLQSQHEQEILALQEEQLLDEEIKKRFCDMLNHAEQEIFIVSPWISEQVTKWILPILKRAVLKRVKIHIIYGLQYNYSNDDKKYKTSKQLIKQYQKELGNFLTVEEIDTHIKVCVCDNKYYLMGSHNFLSYDGYYGNYKDTWHELCSYGQNTEKAKTLKQKCSNIR